MKFVYSVLAVPALAVTLAVCLAAGASASPMAASAMTETIGDIETLAELGSHVEKVAHKTPRRGKVKQRNRRQKNIKRRAKRHHKRFHQRYNKRQKGYKRAHRRFHKHYRRPHRRSGVTIRIYPNYDPYRYNPYVYDPYYDAPFYSAPSIDRTRLSCQRVRRILRHHGYRRVRAYDCSGRTYKFYAIYKGRRYKIRASAYSGQIRSRKRY